MNKNAKKWLAALRSGRFKQIKNNLCARKGQKSLGYCCLGVACEIFRKENPDILIRNRDLVYEFDDGNEDTFLPSPVRKWLGLGTEGGDPLNQDLPSCVSMNDDDGFSFREIADRLERNHTEYFES